MRKLKIFLWKCTALRINWLYLPKNKWGNSESQLVLYILELKVWLNWNLGILNSTWLPILNSYLVYQILTAVQIEKIQTSTVNVRISNISELRYSKIIYILSKVQHYFSMWKTIMTWQLHFLSKAEPYGIHTFSSYKKRSKIWNHCVS